MVSACSVDYHNITSFGIIIYSSNLSLKFGASVSLAYAIDPEVLKQQNEFMAGIHRF